ncbi:DUF2007 domain-containing protein [Endozoicomonas sp. SM1973]|uniref:DUF2007 domain-containing protein n=1 Tax=Spartinivicinus marinus TaxID=2994442 RepID=A0A853I4Y2_9GAMM|nr:DUF2007 domain-containing protein [Spartinivicinus marinus]MCX4030098.1 DUF2007 domain-containing protein [Spartinivicinus marinus]NYZ64657.1 DUF2007 domain-containing protein [Spartinivicinus marinus]
MNKNKQLVTVGSYTDAIQAHLARGKLEAEGIFATVAHEHHIWADWMLSNALGGVKVQVHADQVEQAKQIVANLASGQYAIEDEYKIHCPKCNSVQVEEQRTRWKIAFLGLFIFHIPLPYRRGKLKCLDCDHHWLFTDSANQKETEE